MKTTVGMKVTALNGEKTWWLEEWTYNGEVVEASPEKIKVKFSEMKIKKFELNSKGGREVKEIKKYKICETATFVCPEFVCAEWNEMIYFEEKSEDKSCVYKHRVIMLMQ